MPSPLNKTIRLSVEDAEISPPQYSGQASGLFVGNVIEVLDVMPEHAFDLIIADPPYNLGVDFGNNRDRWSKRDYLKWIESWVAKLPRVLSKTGSVYICCD